MAANIASELTALTAALADRRGDQLAEPRVTAALLTHLLVSSEALLQNLLIDTASKPVPIGSLQPHDGADAGET